MRSPGKLDGAASLAHSALAYPGVINFGGFIVLFLFLGWGQGCSCFASVYSSVRSHVHKASITSAGDVTVPREPMAVSVYIGLRFALEARSQAAAPLPAGWCCSCLSCWDRSFSSVASEEAAFGLPSLCSSPFRLARKRSGRSLSRSVFLLFQPG